MQLFYYFNEHNGMYVFMVIADFWLFSTDSGKAVLEWHHSCLFGIAFWARSVRMGPENLYQVRRSVAISPWIIFVFALFILPIGAFAIGQFFEARMLAGKAYSLWSWVAQKPIEPSIIPPRMTYLIYPSLGLLLLAFFLSLRSSNDHSRKTL